MVRAPSLLPMLVFAVLGGCSAAPATAPAATVPAADADPNSILSGASPAPASTSGPIEELTLRFDPPARLDELMVEGPAGGTAIMVDAVGERPEFRVPVDLQAKGDYIVHWRAHVGAVEHRGQYKIAIK